MRPVLLAALAILLPLASLSGTQADRGWSAPDVEIAIEGHTVTAFPLLG